MSKPAIELNLGRETSDDEVAEIVEAFSPYFEVSYERSIVRLSADWLPLIIDFTVAAVGGGLLYDTLKGALTLLQEKFRTKKLERKPAAVVRVKKDTFVATEEKIFLQSVDVELNFETVEEFVEYLKANEE
jgi:hypothetical protein